MKLNPIELLLINNPLRDVVLRSTLAWLHDAACAPIVGRALEIGCGQGAALEEIARRFRPRALGRATPINKRTSHIAVALTPVED